MTNKDTKDDPCEGCNEAPINCKGLDKCHKPDPNESVSSSRTRGSLAASSGQNEVEATALNSPPFSGRVDVSLSQTNGDLNKCDDDCATCDYWNACSDWKPSKP